MSTLLLLSATCTLLAADAPKVASTSPLELLREASQASLRNLASGAGKGKLTYSERAPGQPAMRVIWDGTIQVSFDTGRYHIELSYDHEPERVHRRVVIYDGSAIVASRFSDLISPTGCEGEVWAGAGAGEIARPYAIIPWDVTKLPHSLVYVPSLLKNISPEAIIVTTSHDGDYTIEFRAKNSDRVRIVCEFSRKCGLNVVSSKIFNDAETSPAKAVFATWKKSNTVWYIDSIVQESNISGKAYRWELKYDDFDANPQVSPELFTIAALGMPGASRIIDHRQAAKDRAYFIPVEDKLMEEKMDSMIERLKSLPTQPPRRLSREKLGATSSWYWFIAVNVALVTFLVSLVLVQRRRKKR